MNGIKQRVLLAVSWSAFALLLNTGQASAAQMMEVFCTDTDGKDLNIWVFHEGENGDHGNPHQSWIERWTDDYFFQLNYQHSGLQSEEGLPYSWYAFQLDLDEMTFTYRTLWNGELESEQEGSCSAISLEQV